MPNRSKNNFRKETNSANSVDSCSSSTQNVNNDKNKTFNENDRKQLNEINLSVKRLLNEVNDLRQELKESKYEIKLVKIENERLKQALNLNIVNLDALEQYNRRENIRIHGVTENEMNRADDGEQVAFQVADALGIELEKDDIQRAHRLGKRRKNARAKPRPVIVRFVSYKKRNQFLKAKSNLKEIENLSDAFITEDLTPLRAKLLHYMKTECSEKFVSIHTINGNIRMKKSAKKPGEVLDGKDEGTGNWIYVKSIDDLFKLGVDLDFAKLGYDGLNFNCDVNNADIDN